MTDRSEQAGVIARHQREIWRYLRYLGCDAHTAEDLTQETFVVFLRKPFADHGAAATAAYLRAIARNLACNAGRRREAVFDTAELAQAEAVWSELARDDGGEGYLAALRECLQKLQAHAREALALQYARGLARREIGARLKLGEEGVKSLLARAKTALRECVERKSGE